MNQKEFTQGCTLVERTKDTPQLWADNKTCTVVVDVGTDDGEVYSFLAKGDMRLICTYTIAEGGIFYLYRKIDPATVVVEWYGGVPHQWKRVRAMDYRLNKQAGSVTITRTHLLRASPAVEPPQSDDEWHIHSLGVDRAYRGHGIGRRMMQLIVNSYGMTHDLSLRVGAVGVDPHPNNAELVMFYQSFGFVVTQPGKYPYMVRTKGTQA